MKTKINRIKRSQQPQALKDRERIRQTENKVKEVEKKEKPTWNPSALYF